ncbi:uncharacterized protein [Dendropsophus ebraccatus]|uniref:uncharacterized protein isoform X1 n=1 Tax=Dendropsophus ebraccatus TaxID=150705 RepID=UPI0038312806
MEVLRVLEILVLCSFCFGGDEVSSSDLVIESAIPQDGGGHISRRSVGIIVGLVLAVIVFISCAIYWYCRRRWRRRRPNPVYLEEVVIHRPDIPKTMADKDELQSEKTESPREEAAAMELTLQHGGTNCQSNNVPLEAVIVIMEQKKKEFISAIKKTKEALTISPKMKKKLKAQKFKKLRSWLKKTKMSEVDERREQDMRYKRVMYRLEKRRQERRNSMERKMRLKSRFKKAPWLWCSTCR